jgi:hypothetical protein
MVTVHMLFLGDQLTREQVFSKCLYIGFLRTVFILSTSQSDIPTLKGAIGQDSRQIVTTSSPVNSHFSTCTKK